MTDKQKIEIYVTALREIAYEPYLDREASVGVAEKALEDTKDNEDGETYWNNECVLARICKERVTRSVWKFMAAGIA